MSATTLRAAEHASVARRPSRLSIEAGFGFEARLAHDGRTRRDAFRLRHLSYHSKGYIEPQPNEEFSDPYDRYEANNTIVVYERGVPVGSVRVCRAGPGLEQDLPVAKVFPEEIAALMKGGGGDTGSATELNRLVRHPDHADSTGLVFILFRLATFMVRQQPPDFLASCVRANHAGFYRRMRFEHVAGPRPYTDLKFATSLLVCPRPSLEMIIRTIPMLRMDAAADARYARMLKGETVDVFEPGRAIDVRAVA